MESRLTIFAHSRPDWVRHPREGGGPFNAFKIWIPAFAGMTTECGPMLKRNFEIGSDMRIVLQNVNQNAMKERGRCYIIIRP